MRVNYRASAGAVIVVFLILVATRSLFNNAGQPAAVALVNGASAVQFCADRWDLSMLGQSAVAVWFVTFPILMTQGLRNRSVPRWLSIPSLIAFTFLMYGELVMKLASDCPYTRSSIFRASILVLAVCVMCLHQIFQRPIRVARVTAAVVLLFLCSIANAQTTVIRAGKLVDVNEQRVLTNQVIVIRGDRISEVRSADGFRSAAPSIASHL